MSDLVPLAPGTVHPRKLKFPKTIGPQFTNKIIPWIETYYHSKNSYPLDSELRQQFGFNSQELLVLHNSKFYLQCLDRRGISRPGTSGLDARQLAAIAIITNFSDVRNSNYRLEEAGITPEELQGWYSSKEFTNELSRRAEGAFANFAPSATTQLGRQIERGNLNAIKFYYEITGRASSPEAVNVKRAMQVLIEAVQKHVKDPEVLAAIASEVQAVRSLDS